MSAAFQLHQEAQLREIGIIHAPNLEHVVRAHRFAIPLALATRAVQFWSEAARPGPAFFAGSRRIHRGAARLRCISSLVERFVHVSSSSAASIGPPLLDPPSLAVNAGQGFRADGATARMGATSRAHGAR
jgi:hypothetical protein